SSRRPPQPAQESPSFRRRGTAECCEQHSCSQRLWRLRQPDSVPAFSARRTFSSARPQSATQESTPSGGNCDAAFLCLQSAPPAESDVPVEQSRRQARASVLSRSALNRRRESLSKRAAAQSSAAAGLTLPMPE